MYYLISFLPSRKALQVTIIDIAICVNLWRRLESDHLKGCVLVYLVVLNPELIKPADSINNINTSARGPDNDIVALMYTGGTTGLPKGVMLTHSNLVSAVLSVLYNQPVSVEEREAMSGKRAMMAVAPMCHIQGYLTLCIVLRAAMMCLMLGRFDPGEILETIEEYKMSTFGGLPVMYQMLINHPDFRKRDLSSITSSISGGAALAPELARIWHEVVGSEVGQGYGLTESAGM